MTHVERIAAPSNESATTDRSALITAVPHLRAFARLLKEDPVCADILAQEVIVHARAITRGFPPGNGLKLWLFSLAHHLHQRDLQKAGARRCAHTGTGMPVPAPWYRKATCASQGFGFAFSQLRDEEREALILVEAASLTYAEAASVCGCPTETIKSRVSRARARLLQTLVTDAAPASFGLYNEVYA